MPEKQLFFAVDLAARQAHNACNLVIERITRAPSVQYHSRAQRDFAQYIKAQCREFKQRLEEIVSNISRDQELLEEKKLEDQITNYLDKCDDIFAGLRDFAEYAHNVVELDVFDLPSPLVLWVQKTFELLVEGKQLLVGHTDEDDFIIRLGIGSHQKLTRTEAAAAKSWQITQYPRLRPLALFDAMILYHEIMHPIFIDREILKAAVPPGEEGEILSKVSVKSRAIASQLAKEAGPLFGDEHRMFLQQQFSREIHEVIKKWAAELFCDFGAAAIAGPSFLAGAILYDYDLPARRPEEQELRKAHPPMGFRRQLLWEALCEAGWSEFLENGTLMQEWIEKVKVPDSIFLELEKDTPAEQMIKCAFGVLQDHYIRRLREKAVETIEALPAPFRSSPQRTARLWGIGKKHLKEGIVPFVFTPGDEAVSPIDIINVSSMFLISQTMDNDWKDYEVQDGIVLKNTELMNKLSDLTLKSLEDALIIHADREQSNACVDKG